MDMRLKTTNYKVTTDVEKYLDARLGALEKILGRDAALKTRCEVEIGRAAGNKHNSDYMWYAEMRVVTTGAKPLYARNHAASVNAAIDDVKEEVGRQVRKEKKMRTTDTRKKGREVKKVLRG
jgi:ribosome-associated translation inhibitor RaiA